MQRLLYASCGVALVAACGRVNFDPLGSDPDAQVSSDARIDGAPLVCAQSPCLEPIASEVTLLPNPTTINYAVIGSTLYFAGTDATNGTELWRTDGTDAGTFMVADIHPSGSSQPMLFTALGDTLLFTADDGARGRELWRTDGTAAGTTLVADIHPTASGIGFMYKMSAIGGTVLFAANDGVTGVELWRSDGTAAGTQLVHDINTGTASSTPNDLIALDADTVIFRARDVSGAELWRSDGTTNGTTLIVDAAPGPADSLPEGWFRYFAVVDGVAYYRGTEGTNGLELWRSDGTALGTRIVLDVQPGAGGGVFDTPYTTPGLGRVLFSARDATAGNNPFISDGTSTGTVMLGDLNPTGDAIPSNAMFHFTEWNNQIFFRASDGVTDQELWVTDGTPASTRQVKDINPTGMSSPNWFFVWRGALYFSASDGVTGQQLWTTDGTAGGTSLVQVLEPAGDAWPFFLGEIGGAAILGVDDATVTTHLWRMY